MLDIKCRWFYFHPSLKTYFQVPENVFIQKSKWFGYLREVKRKSCVEYLSSFNSTFDFVRCQSNAYWLQMEAYQKWRYSAIYDHVGQPCKQPQLPKKDRPRLWAYHLLGGKYCSWGSGAMHFHCCSAHQAANATRKKARCVITKILQFLLSGLEHLGTAQCNIKYQILST